MAKEPGEQLARPVAGACLRVWPEEAEKIKTVGETKKTLDHVQPRDGNNTGVSYATLQKINRNQGNPTGLFSSRLVHGVCTVAALIMGTFFPLCLPAVSYTL